MKDRVPGEHDHRSALVAWNFGEPDIASFGLERLAAHSPSSSQGKSAQIPASTALTVSPA